MDFWDRFDAGRVWAQGFAVLGSKSVTLPPLCYLCGSAGCDELLYCGGCCEPFHPFCVAANERLDSTPSQDASQKTCSHLNRSVQLAKVADQQLRRNGENMCADLAPIVGDRLDPHDCRTQTATTDGAVCTIPAKTTDWLCRNCAACQLCKSNRAERMTCYKCGLAYHQSCLRSNLHFNLKRTHRRWTCFSCCTLKVFVWKCFRVLFVTVLMYLVVFTFFFFGNRTRHAHCASSVTNDLSSVCSATAAERGSMRHVKSFPQPICD